MPTGVTADRYKGFKYLIETDGILRGGFGACTGLAAAHRAVGYYVGDDEIDLGDVAEVEHSTRLSLGQGVAFDDALYYWQRSLAEGKPEAHDGVIIELDGRGRVRHVYLFSGAKPSFYQGVLALGSGGERSIDKLELTYDNLTLNTGLTHAN